MDKNNILEKPIIKVSILCLLSLFVSFICFYFLDSEFKINNKLYSAGGAIAGFIITFMVLSKQMKSFIESPPSTDPLPLKDTDTASIGSYYSPSSSSEQERLLIQANRVKRKDINLINNIVSKIDKDKLLCLDIGCADGAITNSRFINPKIGKVIGIDKEMDIINKACNSNSKKEIFEFRVLSFDDGEIEKKLKNILKENDSEGFDLIFSSLAIHHFSNPEYAINIISNILNEKGIFLYRGTDDGAKICYPKNDLMEKILGLSNLKEFGASERNLSRMMYQFLLNNNLKNISSDYEIFDTVNMSQEEREDMFVESFSYRANYLEKAFRKGNIKAEKHLTEMKKLIDMFRKDFIRPNFYYFETAFYVSAQKINL